MEFWGGTTHLAHRLGAEEIIAVLDEEEAAAAENLEREDCTEALQDAIFWTLFLFLFLSSLTPATVAAGKKKFAV
jgi:hypothetical protein